LDFFEFLRDTSAMGKLFFSLLIFTLILTPPASRASDDIKVLEDISEKARARLYDGGADEQPLVVQQSLSEPRADGSESSMQKQLLDETDTESNSVDETTSGF